MAVRVGINGFGRIGRNVFKALYGEYGEEVEIVAANDLGDVDTMAHLLKYDSVYGPFFGGEVEIERTANGISLDGDELRILAERDPAKLPWGELGVDMGRIDVARHRREQLDVLRPQGAREAGEVADLDLVEGAVLDIFRCGSRHHFMTPLILTGAILYGTAGGSPADAALLVHCNNPVTE